MKQAGFAIIALLIAFAILFGGGGNVDTSHRLEAPSSEAFFGTDTLGRDLFARVAGGVGMSVAVAAVSVAFSFTAGVVLSYLYTLQHFPREILLSVSDSLKAVPSIVLALFLASLSGPGVMKLAIAISLGHIADISRTAYSRTASIMGEAFIESERAIGARHSRIFFSAVLPHVIPYLALQCVSVFLSSVIAESTLSYLGCGLPVSLPSLGSILAEARPVLLSAPWMIIFPGCALLLIGTALELIALSFSESHTSS